QLDAVGATFAGRDVFGPAAAHLCNGFDLADFGEPVDAEQLMPGVVPLPQADELRAIAQVLWVDRFGNAQLNVGPDDLAPAFGDRVDLRIAAPTDPTGGTTRSATRVHTFGDLAGGAIGLVVDSGGLLAIAMNQRSAAEELGLAVGDQVTLTPGADDDGDDLTQPVALRRPS
ncbi:MAG: SAM hydroxide adenosyltransferase, partial [Ilumatobacteraceae bacterium]